MNLAYAITAFMRHRELKGITPRTMKLYRYYFKTWQEWRLRQGLPDSLPQMTVGEFRDFMTYLERARPHATNANRRTAQSQGWSASSRARIWSCLRAFWNFCEEEDLLTDKQARYFRGGRIPEPKVKTEIRTIYTDEQIEQLLIAAAKSDAPERNRAIILLLLESGMRAEELCSLRIEKLDMPKRTGIIVAKGGHERYIFWGPRAAHALHAYLRVGNKHEGYVFRGEIAAANRLAADSIRSMLRRLATEVEIDLPKCPVHTLRHTFARKALLAGIDGFHLQQLLGHKSYRTTERYVRECPEKLRKVHGKLWERN